MHKLTLSLIVILSLNACKERHGPQPATSKFTGDVFSQMNGDSLTEVEESQEEVRQIESENVIVEDIPVLEDDLPVLPIPKETMENTSENSLSTSGGTITDGLDVADIRISQSAERTRIVFDSYSSKTTKASVSGHYTATYKPELDRIELIVSGYRHFSALGESRSRMFPANSIIKEIYLTKMLDDSAFQCNIDLNAKANVKTFDLKEPGRIVIDILP
jgi:hypothetical protein